MASHQHAVVFSFETGEQLDGAASEGLVRACETDPDGGGGRLPGRARGLAVRAGA
jgi:hypothetical protein